MNLSEIRARVITLIGEDASSLQHYTTAELNRTINDAYRDIARETQALEVVYQTSLVAGQGEYDIPESVDRVFRVAVNKEKIFPTTVHELDRFQENWDTDTGTSLTYTLDQLNKNTVRLFRTPAEGDGVNFDSELGVVGDISQTGLTDTFDSELGVLGDIVDADGDNVILFGDEDGNLFGNHELSAETGEAVAYTGATFNQEVGVVVAHSDDEPTTFNQETGVIIAVSDLELGVVVDFEGVSEGLEVWARKDPDDMEDDSATPDLPSYNHMAVVYEAASRALRKNSEVQNLELSQSYQLLADEQVKFLKSAASNRTPEMVRRMRPLSNTRTLKRFARLPSTYPRVF